MASLPFLPPVTSVVFRIGIIDVRGKILCGAFERRDKGSAGIAALKVSEIYILWRAFTHGGAG